MVDFPPFVNQAHSQKGPTLKRNTLYKFFPFRVNIYSEGRQKRDLTFAFLKNSLMYLLYTIILIIIFIIIVIIIIIKIIIFFLFIIIIKLLLLLSL